MSQTLLSHHHAFDDVILIEMIDHRVKYTTNEKYTRARARGRALRPLRPYAHSSLFISASLRAHTRLQAPSVHGPLMLLCSRTGRSAQDLGHGSRPSFDACTYLLSLTGTLILELDISYWILRITAKNRT